MLRNDGRRVDPLTSDEHEEFGKPRREVFEPPGSRAASS
jgi:hypothetical protein